MYACCFFGRRSIMGPFAKTASIGWCNASISRNFLSSNDHAILFNTHIAGADPLGHAMKYGVWRQHCYYGRLRNRLGYTQPALWIRYCNCEQKLYSVVYIDALLVLVVARHRAIIKQFHIYPTSIVTFSSAALLLLSCKLTWRAS